MAVRVKKLSPALKHGGYSATGLLPGEDRAAFEKLHRDLQAELRPDGPFEKDIVTDIAKCIWRKNHLDTLRKAKAARKRDYAIRSALIPDPALSLPSAYTRPDPAKVKEAAKTAEMLAREELGRDYIFVEMEDLANPADMFADLEVVERLDARIDKLFKRLMMLKTFKSLSSSVTPIRRRASHIRPKGSRLISLILGYGKGSQRRHARCKKVGAAASTLL